MSEYIYCKDKMPSDDDSVLISVDEPGDGQFVYGSYYDNGKWYDFDGNEYQFPLGSTVYAWMPWPDPAPLPEEATE
jgi:hypothetical protein